MVGQPLMLAYIMYGEHPGAGRGVLSGVLSRELPAHTPCLPAPSSYYIHLLACSLHHSRRYCCKWDDQDCPAEKLTFK